jgi:predicted RNase H-like nuclease (RuvC/YqgF family)
MTGKYVAFVCAFLFLCVTGTSSLRAQDQQEQETEEVQNLKNQYKELYTKSESYNNYKVIKNSTLNAFWGTVEDSIAGYRSQIQNMHLEIYNLKESNASMKNRIDILEKDLEEAVARADSLKFLGINIHKNAYHAIVWSIVGGLVVLAFFAFSGFIRSKKLSAVTRKEFRELVDEFDSFRKVSHANKVKLGRELQDERNKVEDLKESLENAGVKSSNGQSKTTSNM